MRNIYNLKQIFQKGEESMRVPKQFSALSRATIGLSDDVGNVKPAAKRDRPSGPYGPIGHPGQNCYQACWHVCMTLGGGFGLGDCIAKCKNECTEIDGLSSGLLYVL